MRRGPDDGLDWEGLNEFLNGLSNVREGMAEESRKWLEALGFDLLYQIQQEIIRTGTVDTRRLLNSFDVGDGDGVWKMSSDGLTLEVGTNVEYAKFANDGHLTVRHDTPGAFKLPDGSLARFVPGTWSGDRFIYDPNADTGMLLKEKWIEGSHYFDNAVKIFRIIFGRSLDKKLRVYIDKRMRGGRKRK